MAGTDANTAGVVPGFSLHDELQSLNQAGLSPAQSLRAATATPAGRMKDKAGTLAPGLRADMVLLRANPLGDIANTRAIEGVIVNGRYLARSELDAILSAVEKTNHESRSVPL
jgi:imidazolonepropionase-like amidohydrolase